MHQAMANQRSKDKKKKVDNRGTISLSEYRVKRQSTIEQLDIKKEFYGLDEASSFFLEIWNTHKALISNFSIVFMYYLLGGWYYSTPNIMNKPMGTPDDSASIAMVCMYFITVTATSVGYGDYFPVEDNARIFTIVYIFAGIGVIGRVLNEFAQMVIDFAETKAAERRNRNETVEEMNQNARLGCNHISKIVNALGTAFLTLMCGTIFFTINEQFDFIKALYFVVVTSSTVGYGDITPSIDSSKLFLIFYIITSCIIVAVAIGNIAQVFMEMADERRRLEMMQRKLDFNMIRELDKEGKGIDKATFLAGMLVELGLVNEEKDVKPWIKKFEELDVSGDGLLNVEDCIQRLEQAEDDRVNHLLELMSQAEEERKVMDVLGNVVSFLHLDGHHHGTAGSNVEMTGVGGKARSATTVPVTKNPMRGAKHAGDEDV